MTDDNAFNEKEFARLLERDRERFRDNEPGTLTQAECREIREFLADRKMRTRAMGIVSATAKWIVIVGLALTALNTGGVNLWKLWIAK